MSKIKKLIIVILSCFIMVASVVTGVLVSNNKNDETNNTTNNNQVEEGEQVSPPNYDGMIYYATPSEDTGASVAEPTKKGGVIYLESGSTFELVDGTLSNNESYYGGAVYISKGATFNMRGGVIENCHAMYGGAIYIEEGGFCNILGGSIINNTAEDAPAIYVESGATLTVNNANAVIDKNGVLAFDEININFYVDGVNTKSAVQFSPKFNMKHSPKRYDECNGYFLDENMTIPIEEGLSMTKALEDVGLEVEKDSQGFEVYNLYTASATNSKLTFTELSDGNYSATIKAGDDIGKVVIPKMYDGEYVTTLVSAQGKTSLNSAYISSNIISLPNNMFYKTGLAKFNFTNNLVSIGSNAFREAKLENIFVSKFNNFTTIGSHAFAGNAFKDNATVDLSNWASVAEIPSGAFANTTGFTTFIAPSDALATIGELSFYNTSLVTADFSYSPNLTGGLGESAFSSSTKLSSVVFNENNTISQVYGGAFKGTKISKMPVMKNLNEIHKGAFQNTLIDEVDLSNVYLVAENAFSYTKIKSLVLPHNDTNSIVIGPAAFKNCTELTDVSFGDKAINFNGPSIFEGCTNLTKLNTPSLDYFVNSSYYVQNSNPLYFAKNLYVNNELVTSLSLSTYAEIKPYTFVNLANPISWLEINADYETIFNINIGHHAFYNATGITTMVVAPSVQSIGDYAFYNASALEKIIVLNGKTIGDYAFANCTSLSGNVYFGAEITSIGNYAFNNTNISAEGLGNLKITTIGEYTFASCPSLGAVTIPDTCTTISQYAFNKSGVTSVTMKNVETIETNAFAYCNNLVNVDFGDKLTEIKANAFLYSRALNEISFPRTITTIGVHAFYDSGIKSLDLSNVTTIEEGAFAQMSSIETLKVNAVTNFGSAAFYHTYVKNYYVPSMDIILNSNYVSLSSNPMNNCNNVYTNEVLLEELNLSDYSNLKNYVFAGGKSIKTLIIPSGIELSENIIGNLGVENLNIDINDMSYVLKFQSTLKNLVLGSSITELSTRLTDCTKLETITVEAGSNLSSISTNFLLQSNSIKTVDLSNATSLSFIGEAAFAQSTLETIILPNVTEHLITIENLAFYYCKSLTSINLDSLETLETIAGGMFNYCELLPEISIPASVKSLGDKVFYDCRVLTTINIPEDSQLSVLGQNDFTNCRMLTNFSLPDAVEELPFGTFYKCYELDTFTIPASCTTIGDKVFKYCESITEIVIPEHVEYMGKEVFEGCISLTDVIFKSENIHTIGANMFYDCSGLEHVFLNDTMIDMVFIPEENLTGYDVREYWSIFYGCSDAFTLYTNLTEKPDGWTQYWDILNIADDGTITRLENIVWGYSRDTYNEMYYPEYFA